MPYTDPDVEYTLPKLVSKNIYNEDELISFLEKIDQSKNEEIKNRQKIETIIDLLELQPYRYQPVGLLPYGIQKRVELGRALSMEPRILLLDEPVAGMNLEETEDMARYILEINNELEISILLVEHDMAMVMDIADCVMALDFGQTIAIGSPKEVQGDERVIAAYLGEAP